MASGMPGPSSATSRTASASRWKTRTVIVDPGGVWRTPLSIRLSATRWSSSGLPSTLVGSSASVDRVFGRDGADLGGRGLGDRGEVAGAPGALAAGVGAREDQEVADQAAHPLRRAQRGLDHLGLLALGRLALEGGLEQLEVRQDRGERRAELVRGVGDELALRVDHALRLVAGGVELPEHLVERRRKLGDLVLGLRLAACVRAGSRVVAISRAVVVSAAIGPIARPATARPGKRGEDRAARDADREEEPEAADGRVELVVVAGHLDVGDAGADQRGVDLRRRDVEIAEADDLGVRRGQVGRRSLRSGRRARGVIRTISSPIVSSSSRNLDDAGFGVDLDRERDAVGGRLELVAEVVLEPLLRELSDDRREGEEDHEGEAGRDAREAPANGPARWA